ncbi:MAG: FumA C-terminus/TtdB family hydratase beta subunit [Synergistaceae bacterium]
MIKKITAPLTEETVKDLKIGDIVHLSGNIIVARDAAHKRMVETLQNGGTLPFSLENEVIFYAGPAPTPPNAIIGPIGPTTSYRMDPYTPYLLAKGVKGMIGKGKRSEEVLGAIKKYKAVYLGATGGTSVLLSSAVISSRELIYQDLGPETVLRLEIKDMPLVVLADIYGGNLYDR